MFILIILQKLILFLSLSFHLCPVALYNLSHQGAAWLHTSCLLITLPKFCSNDVYQRGVVLTVSTSITPPLN